KYYGTNGSGTKGFYDLPAGGSSDIGTITNGFIPKALNDTLVNSMMFETADNVSIGTSTDIDLYSRLYVYGGTNGANIDARPGGGGYNQAIIDLQSDSFATNFISTYLIHQGSGIAGTKWGTSNTEM